MRRLLLVLAVSALAGCRGEPVAEPEEDAGSDVSAAEIATDADDETSVDSGSETVGDSTAPDTTAPDTTAPDTTAPDTIAPDSAAVDAPDDTADVSTDSGVVDTAVSDADAFAPDGDAALVPFEAAGNDVQCGATRGARMVYMGVAPTFCIDAREVSSAEYAQFLAAGDKPAQQGFCDWNTTYGSAAAFPVDAQPAVDVDWCDAYAYCAWAGKRLCGHLSENKPSSTDAYVDSQWTRACMNGPAGTTYAVGNAPPAVGVCRIGAADPGPMSVGASPSCRGVAAPYDRVFDLMGNVEEWDMSGCAGLKPGSTPTDRLTIQCGRRGGHYATDMSSGRCQVGASSPIDERKATRGFRCCKGPL